MAKDVTLEHLLAASIGRGDLPRQTLPALSAELSAIS